MPSPGLTVGAVQCVQLREQPGLCSVPCDGVSALCHVAVPVLCAMCWCFVPCHCMCQQQEQRPIPPQGTQTHRHGLELCSSAGSSWALCALSPCRGAEAGAAPMLYSHTAVPPVQGCWLGALSSACAARSDAVGDTAVGLPVLGAAAVQRSAVTQCCCTNWVWDRYGSVQVGFGAAVVQLILFLRCKYSPCSTLQSVECYVYVGVKVGGFCAEQPLRSELHAAHLVAAAMPSPLQCAEMQRCCGPHGLHGVGLVPHIPAAPGERARMSCAHSPAGGLDPPLIQRNWRRLHTSPFAQGSCCAEVGCRVQTLGGLWGPHPSCGWACGGQGAPKGYWHRWPSCRAQRGQG